MDAVSGDRQKEVHQFISKELVPDLELEFDPGRNLLDAGLDSVAMMELIVWLEDHFGIAIASEDLTPENFATLEAIDRYVARAGSAG